MTILGIAFAVLLGAISPGPSFVMTARTAIAISRAAGLAAALGMGTGGVLFATAALFGLHLVLNSVPWLYLSLKVLAGGYLLYLGYSMWHAANEPLAFTEISSETGSCWQSFLSGLITQLCNPKTAVVYASIFAAFLPGEIPVSMMVVLPAAIFAIETGWYSSVALAFSAPTPRRAYLRSKIWIDRIAAGVMFGLGARLLSSAREE